MKRLSFILIFAAGLLAGTFLSLPAARASWPPCRFPYTVQAGDTLSGIAARVGISLWELAWANGIGNVHHIYRGQVLCLPWPIAPPTQEQEAEVTLLVMSSLDLVVQYTFASTLELSSKDPVLSRDNRAGLRLSYPLLFGNDISTYAGPEKVWETSLEESSPLLWLARTSRDSNSYVLVAIGNPSPILDLQVGATRTITEVLPQLPNIGSQEPVTALLDDTKTAVDLYAELISVDGSFVPVNIDIGSSAFCVERSMTGYPIQDTFTQQIKLGSAVHLSLDKFKTIDLPLGLTVTPT